MDRRSLILISEVDRPPTHDFMVSVILSVSVSPYSYIECKMNEMGAISCAQDKIFLTKYLFSYYCY